MERVIHIMLVEDDQLDQVEVKRVLEKRQVLHKLTVARNGEEALGILDQLKQINEKPDIILLDLNMPKMNGFEFLEVIRSSSVWDDCKVFILSTSDDSSEKAQANRLGISGFITKPLKLEHPQSLDAFNLMIDLINIRQSYPAE